MKSVIWTDVFQSAVMIAGLIVTAILGAREVGSLKNGVRYSIRRPEAIDRVSYLICYTK